MIFVVNNEFASATLRGEHIAAELGVPCLFADLGGARNQQVVFVKDADRGLVLDAKDRGNEVIYDPIDLFCYKNRTVPFADLVDVLLVPNKACIEHYKSIFTRARFAVVPHQWDPRITSTAPQDYCRTAYIGKGFNCPPGFGGMKVFNSVQFLEAAPLFNLHLSLNRRDLCALLKPATKIATASAVLANVVSYADPGAVELLGVDYPFLASGDNEKEIISFAQKCFGNPIWKRARERMKEVRERTSLKSIASLYRDLVLLAEAA